MGGEEGMDSSYSALFSTLLESNALLRDEIQQLRQDHRRTLSALELLHVQNLQGVPQHTQTSSRRVADVSSLKEAEGNYRDEVPTAPMGEYRLTKNLPTHPLKDAWVDPQESDLLSSQHAPLRQQGDELHSNSSLTSSGHSSEEENQQTHNRSPGSPSTPASSDHEEEWAGEDQAEMVEGAAVGILSDSSAHSIPAASSSRSVDSSLVSFSGSGTPSESAQSEGNGDPFASPGLVAIGTMWDDFSVEDYAPYEPDKEGAKEKEEWAPRITIPEPFSMTLREERNPKKKSKSMLITEREKMEREAKEEAELKKQFHATPVPASTYIPLYELINAKNHQRREQVQELTKDLLKSTERPFSFTKRDKEKKRLKAEMVRQSQLEKAKSDKEQKFRARPVPKRLFDPQVNEQIREEEEYRRIRVKMRAEELLANSKLPGSMRSRKYTDGELRRRRLEDKQSRAFMTRDHRFHPRINPKVPDYDQLFTDFQKELARRKKANRTTTVEPFYLRTELIPSRKEQVEQELQRDDHVLPETRWPYMAPRSKVSCMAPGVSNHFRSRSAPYPAQLTETARIRQSLTQEKLAGAAEKEVSDEQRRRAKKDRQRELQKAVSQRSVACDPTAWLEDRKKQKLQEFRLDK